jgi:hypothetical protein
MNQEWQFWWSWWVSVAIAVGTIGAVFAALFGQRMRAWLFKPRLVLSVPNPRGEWQQVRLRSPNGDVRTEQARFYHLRVTNAAGWPKATDVQVFLVRIEESGPDGQPQVKWASEIPVKWKHQEIQPLSRTVGPQADSDLCSVVRSKWVQLHPLILPNNLADFAVRRGPFEMVLSFQARAAEASSSMKRIKISWDGQWHDGESEMAQHLVIRELD